MCLTDRLTVFVIDRLSAKIEWGGAIRNFGYSSAAVGFILGKFSRFIAGGIKLNYLYWYMAGNNMEGLILFPRM